MTPPRTAADVLADQVAHQEAAAPRCARQPPGRDAGCAAWTGPACGPHQHGRLRDSTADAGIARGQPRPGAVAHGLSKRFGDRVAFSDVSFEIGYSEVFGFLGPNGAGKTTTVRTSAP
jgi:ABC-type glutathione transport system ATPase component